MRHLFFRFLESQTIHTSIAGVQLPHSKIETAPRNFRSAILPANSLQISSIVPTAVGTPAIPVSAARIPAVDPGRARALAHSNGWRGRYARVVRCHSLARAAVAVPGYR